MVVVGASAGGVEALRQMVAGLPADLPVPVLVVLHVSPTGGSILASILDRASPMRCEPGRHGLALSPGHVYVAPPDFHMRVRRGQMTLDDGPRENGHRPAVDPLFSSAAETFGPRVCAIVLSGTRDDGTAGLAAVKVRGGTTIVQDPADALYPGMPESAMAHVPVDAVLSARAIGPAIAQLVRDGAFPVGTRGHDPSGMDASEPLALARLARRVAAAREQAVALRERIGRFAVAVRRGGHEGDRAVEGAV